MKSALQYWQWIVSLFLVMLCLPAPAVAQSDQGGITILENDVSTIFAEESRFRLVASSDETIEEVTLLYRVSGSPVTSRAYADFTPGTEIDAEWVWEHFQGSLPPGSEVTYYWKLRDTAGRELRTEDASFTYEDDRFDWEETSKGLVHVFTYKGDQGEQLLEEALEDVRTLEQQIGIALEQPIHIYVYADRGDMRLALPSRSDRYDEMTVTLGMVVAADTLLLLGNASNLENTLAHELSHIVVGLATEDPLSDLPRWLDEGLAMYAEGDLPANNQRALDRAIRRDELISVRSLSGYSGDPDMVDLFYAESHNLLSFMLEEYGRDKMLDLLNEFSRGAYQEDALLKIYGFGLEDLDTRWREHLGLGQRGTGVTPDAQEIAEPEGTGNLCGATLLPGILLAALFWAFRPRGAAA